MSRNRPITKRSSRPFAPGFSLPEVTISAAILSTIAIALGLALFRTQHRAADTQAAFTQLQTRNHAIRRITDDLRWATQINDVQATSITCTVPVLGQPDSFEQVSYFYDPDQKSLYYLGTDATKKLLAENVTLFQFGGLATIEGTDVYVNYLEITMQIGTDQRTLIQRKIPLPNRPLL